MDNKHIKDLKVSFPRWFIIFYTFCVIGTFLFFTIYIIYLIRRDFSGSELYRFIIFLFILLAGIWGFSRIIFYFVIATDKGLKTYNIFRSGKSVLWDEIIEVRKPRFGIPGDFTYIFLKNKRKLILLRSMNNYRELIQLIKEKAPNLQKCEF